MPLIIWPVIWILGMVALIVATIIAGAREKKSRVKSVSQSMQPVQMAQDSVAPAGSDGFGDSFGTQDGGFGDDPFK